MQIADVVNGMHDLMLMSQHDPSPISALRQFHMTVANGQHPSPDSLETVTGVPVCIFTTCWLWLFPKPYPTFGRFVVYSYAKKSIGVHVELVTLQNGAS